MSYEKDLLTGIAQMIADSSIAAYNPAGFYTPGQTGVVFGIWPQSPDACVVLNATRLNTSVMIPMDRYLLEVHHRGKAGDPFGPGETSTPIFDLLHNARNITLGSAHVIQILHDHSAPMEQDATKRFKQADIYFIDLDLPATANRPDMGWD
jgi:hypothetical protein